MYYSFALAVLQQLLGLVLLAAGSAKARSPSAMRGSMIAMGLHYRPLLRFGPQLISLLEILVGISLLIGIHPGLAGLAAGLMLAAFTVALGKALISGKSFSCHCFGNSGDRVTTWWSVTRNLGLILASCIVAWAHVHKGIHAGIGLTSFLTALGTIMLFFLASSLHAMVRPVYGEGP